MKTIIDLGGEVLSGVFRDSRLGARHPALDRRRCARGRSRQGRAPPHGWRFRPPGLPRLRHERDGCRDEDQSSRHRCPPFPLQRLDPESHQRCPSSFDGGGLMVRM